MSATQTVRKTITVSNTAHLDEVTLHLELEVNCSCANDVGSYTRVESVRS